ncbi:MAG: phosphoribosylanthranilate isomerase [Mailhella sp.]
MRIKICGMSEQHAIDAAAEMGVDYCGFVFHASSPRNIRPGDAALLKTHGMKRVGVFVKQSVEEIHAIVQKASLDYIQLHGRQSAAFARNFPAEKVIKVFMPAWYPSMTELQEEMEAFSEFCGMYLLDAGMGSGKELDWKQLAHLSLPHPWLLSGGLGEENVAKALSACSPDGVDFNSRLESSPGHKSLMRMEGAVFAVRSWMSASKNGEY